MDGQHPHDIVDAIRNGEMEIPEEWNLGLFRCFVFVSIYVELFVAKLKLLKSAKFIF